MPSTRLQHTEPERMVGAGVFEDRQVAGVVADRAMDAVEKGYRFVDDVIDPYTAVKELVDLAEREGYTFGASTGKKGRLDCIREKDNYLSKSFWLRKQSP